MGSHCKISSHQKEGRLAHTLHLSEVMKLDSINRGGRPSLNKPQCLALRLPSFYNRGLNKLQLCCELHALGYFIMAIEKRIGWILSQPYSLWKICETHSLPNL